MEHIEITGRKAHDVCLERKRGENDDQSTITTKRRLDKESTASCTGGSNMKVGKKSDEGTGAEKTCGTQCVT